MTDQTSVDAAENARRLQEARAVYRRIFTALQASLETLESGTETVADVRNRQDLFRAHIKQLQSVYDLEDTLDTFGTSQGALRLDLDAARTEIRERLARIGQHG